MKGKLRISVLKLSSRILGTAWKVRSCHYFLWQIHNNSPVWIEYEFSGTFQNFLRNFLDTLKRLKRLKYAGFWKTSKELWKNFLSVCFLRSAKISKNTKIKTHSFEWVLIYGIMKGIFLTFSKTWNPVRRIGGRISVRGF